MARALAIFDVMKPILEAPPASPLGAMMAKRPQAVGAATWPYQCAGWNASMRLKRIRDHYAAIEEIGGAIDFPVDGQLMLLDLGEIRDGLSVIVDQPEWFMREGQLTINLFDGETRLYSLVFSFFHHDGQIAAFIGGIQGRDIEDILEEYRKLTKEAQGMRPRDLLIESFRMLCAELDVKWIYAVSDEYRHHRDGYFGPLATKKFSTDYNEVWEDRGGVRVDPMFYQLNVTDKERDLATVSAKKRSMYRRRYEMLARLRSQMHDRYRSRTDAVSLRGSPSCSES